MILVYLFDLIFVLNGGNSIDTFQTQIDHKNTSFLNAGTCASTGSCPSTGCYESHLLAVPSFSGSALYMV